jgi:hypothetical protein
MVTSIFEDAAGLSGLGSQREAEGPDEFEFFAIHSSCRFLGRYPGLPVLLPRIGKPFLLGLTLSQRTCWRREDLAASIRRVVD